MHIISIELLRLWVLHAKTYDHVVDIEYTLEWNGALMLAFQGAIPEEH